MKTSFLSQFYDKPRKAGKRALFFFSFAGHFILIYALLVFPFLEADSDLPDYQVISGIELVKAPVIPPVPQGGRGNSGRSGRNRLIKDTLKPETTHIGLGKFIAPIAIPSTIADDDMFSDLIPAGNGPVIEGAPEGEGIVIEGAPPLFTGIINMPTAATPIRVQRPRLIKEVKPIYPKTALLARIEGTVTVEAITDIYGRVVKTTVISGHPLLNNAALEAVRMWVYEPYIIGSIPKPVVFIVNVHFNIDNR